MQPQKNLSYLIEVSEDSKHWSIAQSHVRGLWHIDGFLTHACDSELQHDSPPTFVTESMNMTELQLLFLSAIFVFTPSSYLMKPSEHFKWPQSSMHLWLVCEDHWSNQVWVNTPWYVFFEDNALKELSIKPAAQTLFASHWRWAMPTSDCVIITRSPRDNEPNSNYAPGYHKSSSETTKIRYLVKTLGSDDQKLGCTCNSLNHKKI